MSFIESLSPDAQSAFWTLAVAIVCSVMCALLGVWMVLQRVSMLGDAISHSVLPGLVITFLVTGTLASWPMFVGAALAGLLSVVLTRLISRASLLREDASMGVVFTVLFALGVLLLQRYARNVDLDPNCVLYGLIELVPIFTTNIGGIEVPRALTTLVPAFLASVIFLFAFRKELALMAFDPPLAKALGKKPDLLYYMLMAVVAMATVASFEAVGSILVIAMLIGPAATAQLLTHKLGPMFGISAVVAILSSIAGYYLAVWWNISVAGLISVVIGVCYTAAVILSPAGGLVHRSVADRRKVREIAEEDILAAAYRLQETTTPATASAIESIVGKHWFKTGALERLRKTGLLLLDSGNYSLSASGRLVAAKLLRRHRLLESFYVEELAKGAEEVHVRADRAEHYLSAAGAEAVGESLGERAHDPHGKQIPDSKG